jgi:hypothetical protein
MRLFSKHCPRCGKTRAYHRVYPTRYAPAAPIAAGGIFLAIVFDQSRKPEFRCEQCGTSFHSHTIVSRVFQLFWAWFVLAVLAIIAVIIWSIAAEIWYR